MYRFVIPFSLLPKPRGKLSRNGHIYHNDKNYTQYKKKVKECIKSQLGYIELQSSIYIGLFSEYIDGGKQPDFLDNQLGSVLDVLVEMNFIQDDNRSICYGDKLLCYPGTANRNTFIIGTDKHIRTIDDEITTLYYQQILKAAKL